MRWRLSRTKSEVQSGVLPSQKNHRESSAKGPSGERQRISKLSIRASSAPSERQPPQAYPEANRCETAGRVAKLSSSTSLWGELVDIQDTVVESEESTLHDKEQRTASAVLHGIPRPPSSTHGWKPCLSSKHPPEHRRRRPFTARANMSVPTHSPMNKPVSGPGIPVPLDRPVSAVLARSQQRRQNSSRHEVERLEKAASVYHTAPIAPGMYSDLVHDDLPRTKRVSAPHTRPRTARHRRNCVNEEGLTRPQTACFRTPCNTD